MKGEAQLPISQGIGSTARARQALAKALVKTSNTLEKGTDPSGHTQPMSHVGADDVATHLRTTTTASYSEWQRTQVRNGKSRLLTDDDDDDDGEDRSQTATLTTMTMKMTKTGRRWQRR